MENRVRFGTPQNISGALQKNSVVAFSQTTEADVNFGLKQPKKYRQRLYTAHPSNPSLWKPSEPKLIWEDVISHFAACAPTSDREDFRMNSLSYFFLSWWIFYSCVEDDTNHSAAGLRPYKTLKLLQDYVQLIKRRRSKLSHNSQTLCHNQSSNRPRARVSQHKLLINQTTTVSGLSGPHGTPWQEFHLSIWRLSGSDSHAMVHSDVEIWQ